MTSEDLFRAIGTVESSRLLRSELTVSENASCDAPKEEPDMKQHTLTRGLRNLLVAAALISALAVTAYAAMKTFGLKDLLSQWGMQDTSALENLTVTPVETDSAPSEGETFAHATRYAGFTVEEAILDSRTLYVMAKITPLEKDCILVPGIAFDEDVVTADGLTLAQVQARAEEEGRTLVYADIRCGTGDENGTGMSSLGYSFRLGEDGAIYYYITGQNTFADRQFQLPCRGITHTGTVESREQTDFAVTITDQSTAAQGESYIPAGEKVLEETGIQVKSITFSETELGVYATFHFTVPEGKYEAVSLRLVTAEGKELPQVPAFTDGELMKADENGVIQETRAYQKPFSPDGLKLIIKDVWGGVSYGPYDICRQ